VEAKMITKFNNEYRWLSNFYPAEITCAGRTYSTAEHFYQAQKTTSLKWFNRIRETSTPGKAKRLGQKAPLRADWEDSRVHVMRIVVREKFRQHPELMEKLMATGSQMLVEGNRWHDQFWGNCLCPEHYQIDGENWLGRILMEVRKGL